jgi:hypothetical protein
MLKRTSEVGLYKDRQGKQRLVTFNSQLGYGGGGERSSVAVTGKPDQKVLANSREEAYTDPYMAEVAAAGGVDVNSSKTGLGGSAIVGQYEADVIEGIVTSKPQVIRKLARDMYYHDTIAGSAADLMSNLPFSDFSLSGVNDEEVLKVFVKSIENLKLKTLFPQLSIDYIVDGAFVGTFSFNKSRGIFSNVVTHNQDNLEFLDTPIYGMDPIIDMKVPKNLVELFNSKDDRAKKALKNLPEFYKQAVQGASTGGSNRGGGGRGGGNRIALDPASTVYIGRKTFSYSSIGTSAFRRLIPLWIMEKALMRGTMEQAYARQRAILHITMGDEVWEPTDQEMQAGANLFATANLDPTGAVVVTRQGVLTNEVRRGDDLWKHSDVYDYLAAAKLKGLGINETFLSGEASYNTLETALSVFMEQLRSYRQMVTRELFYDKLFPAIAVANNFKNEDGGRSFKAHGSLSKSERARLRRRGEYISPYRRPILGSRGTYIMKNRNGDYMALCDGSLGHDLSEIEDITEYQIPTVNWHKQLQPQADEAYLNILQIMTQNGVPVPLRMIAAAGGMNLDQVMDQFDDDLQTRKDVSKQLARLEKFMPQQPGMEQANLSEADRREMNAALQSFGRTYAKMKKPRGEFDTDRYRVYERDSRGQRRIATSSYQKRLEEKQNKKIAAALLELASGGGKLNKREIKRLAMRTPSAFGVTE